ncbi:hypothetical protein FAIPA1_340015 [Frankia sp. AiPs1]
MVRRLANDFDQNDTRLAGPHGPDGLESAAYRGLGRPGAPRWAAPKVGRRPAHGQEPGKAGTPRW